MIKIYFGVPGSGKTTLATLFVRKQLRKNKHAKPDKQVKVFSNVPILGAYQFDPKEDLGNYLIENSLVIIDECAIEFNNRSYNTLSKNIIQWAKLHRHYNCDVLMFSQSYDDMDITFRRLADRFFLVRKSVLPFFIFVKPLRKFIGLDDEGQILDKYEFQRFQYRWYFMPLAWKYFDSYEAPILPEKDFTVWGSTTRY